MDNEQISKKIIGNALAAYFLIFVSLAFLWSRDPNIQNTFVRSHVKVAGILHIFLMAIIVIMSFEFGESIYFLQYSLNTIITIILLFAVFLGILYGAYTAYKGRRLTLGELFGNIKNTDTQILQNSEITKYSEEQKLQLILAHIPYIGYIIAGRHENTPHIRDISLVNMIVVVISIMLIFLGNITLANILLLLYTIWSVFQCIKLVLYGDLTTLNTNYIPTPSEKISIQKALLHYIGNNLKKNTFTPLKTLISEQKSARGEQEIKLTELYKNKTDLPISKILVYIPFVNLIGIFFLHTRLNIHIKNGLFITFIITLIILFLSLQSILILGALIPVCYGIGKLDHTVYMMPYIYDSYHTIGNIFIKIGNLGKKAQKLHKTETKTVIHTEEKL